MRKQRIGNQLIFADTSGRTRKTCRFPSIRMYRQREVSVNQVYLPFIDVIGDKRTERLLMQRLARRTLKIAINFNGDRRHGDTASLSWRQALRSAGRGCGKQ